MVPVLPRIDGTARRLWPGLARRFCFGGGFLPRRELPFVFGLFRGGHALGVIGVLLFPGREKFFQFGSCPLNVETGPRFDG